MGGEALSSPARSGLCWGYEPQTLPFKPFPSRGIGESYISHVWCPVDCIYGCMVLGWVWVHEYICCLCLHWQRQQLWLCVCVHLYAIFNICHQKTQHKTPKYISGGEWHIMLVFLFPQTYFFQIVMA